MSFDAKQWSRTASWFREPSIRTRDRAAAATREESEPKLVARQPRGLSVETRVRVALAPFIAANDPDAAASDRHLLYRKILAVVRGAATGDSSQVAAWTDFTATVFPSLQVGAESRANAGHWASLQLRNHGSYSGLLEWAARQPVPPPVGLIGVVL